MSDHTLDIQFSILVAGLSLVPGNSARYISLGLALTMLGYHAARQQTPAARINALTCAITSANELLTRAPCTSARDQSRQWTRNFFCAPEKLKSQLQCQLLEIEGHGWKDYPQDVWCLLKSIDKCTKDVKSIRTKLQLSIEQDIQRKLDNEIQKAREVLAAIHSEPRRVTGKPRACACAVPVLLSATVGQTKEREITVQPSEHGSPGLEHTRLAHAGDVMPMPQPSDKQKKEKPSEHGSPGLEHARLALGARMVLVRPLLHPPREPPSSKLADMISVSRVMTSSDSGTNDSERKSSLPLQPQRAHPIERIASIRRRAAPRVQSVPNQSQSRPISEDPQN
ncbi:hypothetical protein GGX14DRAFT_408591 [Mycena pura]|uniref:Uncharacterized protein n=1 Tax=Mycena pura TaxID=153505 RepID=A0AAD6UPV2_9AGAR|nr:hypothetical protein GGX14DRAFT_408591 [Mycena pura]